MSGSAWPSTISSWSCHATSASATGSSPSPPSAITPRPTRDGPPPGRGARARHRLARHAPRAWLPGSSRRQWTRSWPWAPGWSASPPPQPERAVPRAGQAPQAARSLAHHRVRWRQLRRPPWGRRCTGRFPGSTSSSAARPRGSSPRSSPISSPARRWAAPHPGLCYREGGRLDRGPEAADRPWRSTRPRCLGSRSTSIASGEDELCRRAGADVQLLYESARGCWWGAKLALHLLRPQRQQHGVSQQEPARVVAGADDPRPALRAARLPGGRQHPRPPLLPGPAAPSARRRPRPPSLFYELKANVTHEQVRLLRAAGVDRIQPGLESLSTPILRLMKKGVSAFQNVRLLKWAAQYGLRVYWNVIYGFPGEPPPEYARMAKVVPSSSTCRPRRWAASARESVQPRITSGRRLGLEPLGPRRGSEFVYPRRTTATLTGSRLLVRVSPRRRTGAGGLHAPLPGRRDVACSMAGGLPRAALPAGRPGFLVVQDRRPGTSRRPTTRSTSARRSSTWPARTGRRWPGSTPP